MQTSKLTGTVHEDGMKAARAYAGWHLGYTSWADNIVNAYLNPQEAMDRLERDRAKFETTQPPIAPPPTPGLGRPERKAKSKEKL